MKSNIKSNNSKRFYKLSLYMLVYCISLFVFSIITSVLNYYGSKMGGNTIPYQLASIVISTISSLLVVIYWFIGREQSELLEVVMNKKAAWVINVIFDLMELGYVCLNTIASLYNGGVIKSEFTQLMPIVSFLLVVISLFDFIFALSCTIAAKRKIKTQH